MTNDNRILLTAYDWLKCLRVTELFITVVQ